MKFTRRELFEIGTGLGAFSVALGVPPFLSKVSAQPGGPAPTTVPSTGLAVRITSKAGVNIYWEKNARDLGNIKIPAPYNINQRNLVVDDPQTWFTVFFRPDVDGKRDEVIIQRGRTVLQKPDAITPFIIGLNGTGISNKGQNVAYIAEVFKDGKLVSTMTPPWHTWNGEIFYETSRRPSLLTNRDLVARKLVPPFDSSIATVARPPAAPPYMPMGFSNLTPYMPTTGERPEIGVLTEYQAAWVATGDQTMWDAIEAWADASLGFQWHLRDPNTFGPLNWIKYPRASINPDVSLRGDPPILVNVWGDGSGAGGTHVVSDYEHAPSLGYVRFLCTGNPRDLEEMQFQVTTQLNGTMLPPGTTRGFAWGLRSLIDLCTAMRSVGLVNDTDVPRWLLPLSYWEARLSAQVSFLNANYVNSRDPLCNVFFFGTSKNQFGFWQEDYLCSVLWNAVYRGRSELRPAALWKVQSNYARANGRSGWPASNPSCYYAQAFRPQTDAAGKLVRDENGNPLSTKELAKNWSELFQFTSAVDASVRDTGEHTINPRLSLDYINDHYESLALASLCGEAEAGQYAAAILKYMKSKGYITWRTAIKAV